MVCGFLTPILYTFFSNEGITNLFKNIGLSVKDSDIMTGAIAVCIVNLMVYYYDEYNKKKFGDILKHPIVDLIGYILGTFLYTLLF